MIGYGLSERLLPRAIHLDASSTATGRLEQPLTYWNAYGLLAALGAVLALRVAGDPSRPRAASGGRGRSSPSRWDWASISPSPAARSARRASAC